MCGICGIISFNGEDVERRQIKKMMDKIRHRGPDDEGMFFHKRIGLGFLRLSILDLTSGGHQPMQDESGRYTITFNGEIYNYIELRKQLLKKEYKFHSKTDTEVLLKAFIEWDKDCLEKLNGMFAFAIYDKESERLFAARDRFGIKPFYYYKDHDQFLFSSEIPPVLAVLKREKVRANRKAIFSYLTYNRTDHANYTFFEDIYKLKPGSFLNIKGNDFDVKQWYYLSDNLNKPLNNADEFKQLFNSSVKLRLRSDVPVGVCLSGGLDSSSIVSTLIKEHQKHDLNTFSAIYNDFSKDESAFIKMYENQLQNMYYITPTARTLLSDFDDFIKFHGEPVSSSSPYAQYKVMELAKNYVTVTLDGQGADEQLGGYHYFYGFLFKGLLAQLRLLKFMSEGYHYFKQHRSFFGYKSLLFFLLPNKLKTTARANQKDYIAQEFTENYSSEIENIDNLYSSKNLQQSLLNHFNYKLEHLLKWEDRNAMSHSIESRVPFLDHHLVERCLSTEENKIIHKGYTKYILRQSMKGALPEKIRLRQDKIGFATPEDQWFREDFFIEFIKELINSQKFQQRNLYDVEKVKVLYNKHLDNKVNISKEIWKWINLELWYQKFIDKKIY